MDILSDKLHIYRFKETSIQLAKSWTPLAMAPVARTGISQPWRWQRLPRRGLPQPWRVRQTMAQGRLERLGRLLRGLDS